MNFIFWISELSANTVDTSGGDNDLEDEVVDVVGNDNQDYTANTETAEQARGDDEPNEVNIYIFIWLGWQPSIRPTCWSAVTTAYERLDHQKHRNRFANPTPNPYVYIKGHVNDFWLTWPARSRITIFLNKNRQWQLSCRCVFFVISI